MTPPSGEELARQMAARYAEQTEQSLNSSMKVATLLAQTMEGMRQGSMPSRRRWTRCKNASCKPIPVLSISGHCSSPMRWTGAMPGLPTRRIMTAAVAMCPYFTRKPDGSISQEIPGGSRGEVLEYDRPGDGDYYLGAQAARC